MTEPRRHEVHLKTGHRVLPCGLLDPDSRFSTGFRNGVRAKSASPDTSKVTCQVCRSSGDFEQMGGKREPIPKAPPLAIQGDPLEVVIELVKIEALPGSEDRAPRSLRVRLGAIYTFCEYNSFVKRYRLGFGEGRDFVSFQFKASEQGQDVQRILRKYGRRLEHVKEGRPAPRF